jgi:hypothetical protein
MYSGKKESRRKCMEMDDQNKPSFVYKNEPKYGKTSTQKRRKEKLEN